MATAKKTVKKYSTGGPKTSRIDKRITKATTKRDALTAQQKADAPTGMGSAWVGMDPKIKRLDKKVDRLTARKGNAKTGGATKMKKGGATRTKKR